MQKWGNKGRNLDDVRCKKNNDIKERWREYYKLLNKDAIGSLGTREATSLALHTFYRRTKVAKVNKSICKNEARKGYKAKKHSDSLENA